MEEQSKTTLVVSDIDISFFIKTRTLFFFFFVKMSIYEPIQNVYGNVDLLSYVNTHEHFPGTAERPKISKEPNKN